MSSAASNCQTDASNQATKRDVVSPAKLADESVAKLTSSHRAAEGQREGGGGGRKAEVREGAGHGRGGWRRDGRKCGRGRRDGGLGGRSSEQVGDRAKHGGGGEVAHKVGGGAGEGGGAGHGGGGRAGEGGEGAGHGGVGGEHGGEAAEGRGRPCRPGFSWQLGSRLEAKDFMNNWYAAKIINVDDGDCTVLIHFDGWNQRYDEWVKMDSDRLRPLTRHSDRRKKAERKSIDSKPIYKAGENVYARWSDCRMYPAKIVAVNANGSYEVMFEDGVKKTVQAINVDMKPPLSSIGSGIRPAESTGKRNSQLSPDGTSGDSPVTEEKLTTSRKLRGCSVRVKRCLSMSENESSITCKLETIPVAEEEQTSAAEVKMDDQDVKEEKPGTELSTDDVTSDDSPVKRRLIHVKTIHGKLKKTASASPALPVESKTEAEQGTKLKCPHSDCNKEFRNPTLVQYHIKYYHPEDKMDQPMLQPSEKRRSASSFSESPASVHEFPSKKAKRSRTVDGLSICAGASGGDEDAGLADQSPSSLSPLSVLPHSSPSPQGSKFIPKESLISRSRTNNRGMRNGRKKHRIKRMRDRAVSKKKVINCLCGVNRETGQLIQCSVCLCWQHLQCLEEEEANLLRKYICKMCIHPPGLRESARYSFDQDWLVEGHLADFDCGLGGAAGAEPAYGSAGKAKIMKITHQLVADLHGVQQVIDSVDRCIFVTAGKVKPEFSHWKMLNTEDKTAGALERAKTVQRVSACPSVDSKSNVKDEQLPFNVSNGCESHMEESGHGSEPDQSSTHEQCISDRDHKADEKMENQLPVDGSNGDSMTAFETQNDGDTVDGAKDTSSCCSAAKCGTFNDAAALNSTAAEFDKLPGNQPSTNTVQSSNAEKATTCSGKKILNRMPNSPSVSVDEEDLKNDSSGTKPKVQTTVSDNLQEDEEGLKEREDEKLDDLSGSVISSADEGEEEETKSCRNHLLHYISQLQDGIEESIAILEEQVTALESAEGNGNSTEDVLRDLPRVKKAMNQLMTDLSKVQQMSFCQ